jgi:predicted CopG family antitoxin
MSQEEWTHIRIRKTTYQRLKQTKGILSFDQFLNQLLELVDQIKGSRFNAT